MPLRRYHKPLDLKAAQMLLEREDEKNVLLSPGPKPPLDPFSGADAVVDVSGLDLAYVKAEADVIRIGAMTTLQAIAESPFVRGVADGVLAEAAQLSAHLGLRNLATLGGAMASTDSTPEVRLALLALDVLPIMQDNVLTEVRLGTPPGLHAALARVARTPRDAAIVAVCAAIIADGPGCRWATLAVAGPEVQRMDSVAKLLSGQPFTPEKLDEVSKAVAAEAKVDGDYRGSVEYKREMVKVLTKRALAEAWGKAQ
jgi:carbon-monoxide dehydrogenase medium subunit